MHNFLTIRNLKDRTVQNKFNIIIVLIIIILLFSLLNFLFSMKVMASIRSYVGGEGLWSKAQKEAVNNLVAYADTQNQADYTRFLTFIKVPLGDRQARLELDKAHPDLAVARQGFIEGGNDPADVGNLIFLYQKFRHVSYMDSAIRTWTAGDAGIQQLIGLASQIHAINVMPLNHKDPQAKAVRAAQLAPYLEQVYTTDSNLTSLENKFSSTLGAGSRGIATTLTRVTILWTVLIGLLTIVISILIARAIIRLDKAKSEFISTASHQLRTPLTVINWYAETLLTQKHSKLTANQRKQLSELYGGSQRMTHLISDLLSVSSLDLGTFKTEPKNTDVAALIQAVLKDVEIQLEQKHIDLTTNIEPNLPKIVLDPRLLTVVMQNLLSNSTKYTPSGGKISILVGIKRQHLIIKVADTGIGIPEAQQSQIFTKLFRADNAKRLDSNHTGLGLYIAKAMVEQLDGNIWFDSIENQGTNFYVRIPMDGQISTAGKGPKDG